MYKRTVFSFESSLIHFKKIRRLLKSYEKIEEKKNFEKVKKMKFFIFGKRGKRKEKKINNFSTFLKNGD